MTHAPGLLSLPPQDAEGEESAPGRTPGGDLVGVVGAGRMTRVLSPLLSEWSEDDRFAYDERLAIVTLDGRIPLARAEELAEACIRGEAARGTLGAPTQGRLPPGP